MILAWLNLYLIFFKIGLFSFGGGYVMLPLIYQHVELHNLIPLEEFADIVALSQMTPGPIAVNAATYIGFRNAGLIGAIFATIGVISPSIILVLLILGLMRRFGDNPLMKALLNGIKPVTAGMIAAAAVYFLERSFLRGRFFSLDLFEMRIGYIDIPLFILFIIVLIALIKTKVNPLILTLLSGLVAMVFL